MQAPVMQGCMATLGPCAAALGVGAALRRTGVFSSGDGEVRAIGLPHWAIVCSRVEPKASARLHAPPSSPCPQTAAKFVNWVTLPSLILQTFNG